MKKLIYLLLLATTAVACQPKETINSVKDETMKLHDQVMEDHGKIIANQMKIDTLLRDFVDLKSKFPSIDTANEKKELTKIKANLEVAEERMNDWMHQFDGNFMDASEEKVMNYYKSERIKIAEIDQLYKKEIKQSDSYLLKFKN